MLSLTPSRSGTHTLTSTSSPAQPVANASNNHLQDLLGGKFLYGGEGFNAALDAAQNQIQPRVQGAFNSAGRLNSGLAQTAMSQGLADAFARLYGNERNLQSNAALALSPRTDTKDQPLYENDLLNLLGLASTGAGVADTIFGDGATGDFLKSLFGGGGVDNSLTLPPGAGGDFDYSGAGGGIGNDSGVGLPPTPPGSGSFFDFGGGGNAFDAASNSLNLSGLGNVAGSFGAFAPGIGSALGAGVGTGAIPGIVGGPLAGNVAGSFGAFAPGIGSSLGSLGAGSTVGAAAGATPAAGGTLAGGGALAGGLGTALGAAGPLAVAGFGALSVRNKHKAQKSYLAPVLDSIYANRGNKTTVGGVTGVPFRAPDGTLYLANDSAANPALRNNGRAVQGVYNTNTNEWGTLSSSGFISDAAQKRITEAQARRTAEDEYGIGYYPDRDANYYNQHQDDQFGD